MPDPASLKAYERNAFRLHFADGLWDIFLGFILLLFAIAPILSNPLGDFWSSFIFLPLWGLTYLAIFWVRKNILLPRIGSVSFLPERKNKLRKFTVFLLFLNTVSVLISIAALYSYPFILGESILYLFGLFALIGLSIAAWILNYPLFCIYGFLILVAFPSGEWLYQQFRISHHGLPVTVGIVSFVIMAIGARQFIQLLNKTDYRLKQEG